MGMGIGDGIGHAVRGFGGGVTLDAPQSRHDFGRDTVLTGRANTHRTVDTSPPSLLRSLADRLTGVRSQPTQTAPTEQVRTATLARANPETSPAGKLAQDVATHTTGMLRQECENALDDVVDAQRLIGEEPQGRGAMAEYTTALRSMATLMRGTMERLDHMAGALTGQAQTTTGEMVGLLDLQAKQLVARADYLEANAKEHPATRATIGQAKAMEVNAAIRLVDERIGAMEERLRTEPQPSGLDAPLLGLGEKIEQMRDLRADLVARRDAFLGEDWQDTAPLSKDEVKELMGKSLSGSKSRAIASFFGTAQAVVRQLCRDGVKYDQMPPETSKHLNERGMLTEFLSARFKAIGEDAGVGGINKSLQGHYLHALNGQSWNTIDRTVNVVHQGRVAEFHSTQTPASQMGGVFDAYGGGGVCCHDSTEANHTVNLWRSELRGEDGTVLFKGYRHGVHCAYGIGDPGERAEANRNRAMETVTAMVVGDPDKMTAAKTSSAENPVQVDLVSLSLLTPDAFRGLRNSETNVGHANEKRMMREQAAAWQALNEAGAMEVTLHDEDGAAFQAWVKVDATMFNFGVNAGGVGALSGVLGGWGTANPELNNASMAKLIGSNEVLESGRIGGRIGTVVDDLDSRIAALTEQRDLAVAELETASEELRPDVERVIGDLQSRIEPLQRRREETVALAQQVAGMWLDGSYAKEGNEPYKMVSRLAVLVNRSGAELAWNCKSGKDRTSELDVEAKELAATMALENRVPRTDQERTPEQQRRLLAFVESSGSREIQALNTGGPGSKLKGVDALYSQLGLAKNDLQFLGLSDFFKS